MESQSTEPYCGITDVLGVLAKFVIIYAEKIAKLQRESDFKAAFPQASKIFDNEIRRSVKYAKCDNLKSIKAYAKYTLFFVKKNYQAADLCRHLRNSFAHAHLRIDNKKLFVSDENNKEQITSIGYLDKSIFMSFITELINEYEESFPVSKRKRKCK